MMRSKPTELLMDFCVAEAIFAACALALTLTDSARWPVAGILAGIALLGLYGRALQR